MAISIDTLMGTLNYHMMVIITLELSKIPEWKSFIDMKNNELGRNPDPESKLTTDDVRAYCREIIEKAAWENHLKNCATK